MSGGRISFKSAAVRAAGMSPKVFHAIARAGDLYSSRGLNLVVTSLNDGEHRQGSRHYSGDAADLRTHNVPPALRPVLAAELAKALGPGYLVLLEKPGEPSEHIHVEWKAVPA